MSERYRYCLIDVINRVMKSKIAFLIFLIAFRLPETHSRLAGKPRTASRNRSHLIFLKTYAT